MFLQQVAARLGKTAKGQPQDSQETAKDEDSGSEIDKAIYDELRARRDFGFEQVYAPPLFLGTHERATAVAHSNPRSFAVPYPIANLRRASMTWRAR